MTFHDAVQIILPLVFKWHSCMDVPDSPKVAGFLPFLDNKWLATTVPDMSLSADPWFVDWRSWRLLGQSTCLRFQNLAFKDFVACRWAMMLPACIQVCPVEIPGRGRRSSKQAISDLHQLADALAAHLPLQVSMDKGIFESIRTGYSCGQSQCNL